MKRLVIIKFLLLYIKQLPLSQEDITHSLQKAEHRLHFFQCNFRQCSGQKRMIIMKDLTSCTSSISAHKSWPENGLWRNLRQHQSFFLFFFSKCCSKFKRAIYQNQVSKIAEDVFYCTYVLLQDERGNSRLKRQRMNQAKKLQVTTDSFLPLGSSVGKTSPKLQSTTYQTHGYGGKE